MLVNQGSLMTNKIAYITPKMGGFQAGYSIADSGTATATTDQQLWVHHTQCLLAGGSIMLRYNKQL